MKNLQIIGIVLLPLTLCSCLNTESNEALENRERELDRRERVYHSKHISESHPKRKTDAELRQNLEQNEKINPTEYLSVTYDLNYKVFSGKDEITGTINNSATFATYKDVELIVSYSSKTGTLLYTESIYIYEYIYPGSSTDFSFKTYSPEGSKYIGVKVKSASYE